MLCIMTVAIGCTAKQLTVVVPRTKICTSVDCFTASARGLRYVITKHRQRLDLVSHAEPGLRKRNVNGQGPNTSAHSLLLERFLP